MSGRYRRNVADHRSHYEKKSAEGNSVHPPVELQQSDTLNYSVSLFATNLNIMFPVNLAPSADIITAIC